MLSHIWPDSLYIALALLLVAALVMAWGCMRQSGRSDERYPTWREPRVFQERPSWQVSVHERPLVDDEEGLPFYSSHFGGCYFGEDE